MPYTITKPYVPKKVVVDPVHYDILPLIKPYKPQYQLIGYEPTVTSKSYDKTCYPVPEYGDDYDHTNEKLLSLLTLPDWYTNKDGRNTCKNSKPYCPYDDGYGYETYHDPKTYGKAACGKCNYDCKCITSGKPYCGCQDKTYGSYPTSVDSSSYGGCSSCPYSKPSYKKSYGYGKLY